MEIQYGPDLHLEFTENKNYTNKYRLQREGEILLLADDILRFALNHRYYIFFDFTADNFDAVYWIPGNHPYYGYDIGRTSNPLFEKIRSNVFLVNNRAINQRGINIICSIFWSYISPLNERIIQKGLADFSCINIIGKPLLPSHFNELHPTASSFIKSEIKSYTHQKILSSRTMSYFTQLPGKIHEKAAE
ncbi:MAG: hypothetical protein ABI707_01220 [Ferruginibacter sp.]